MARTANQAIGPRSSNRLDDKGETVYLVEGSLRGLRINDVEEFEAHDGRIAV